MKLVVSALGTSLAGATLVALIGLPQQNGASKPQNAPKPAPAPAKPADPPAKPAAQTPAAPGDSKTGTGTPPAAASDKPAGVDSDTAITNRYVRAAEIGDEHKWLGGLQGKWKTLTRQLIKPNSTPIESTGTSEFQLFMDGRFLIENNKSAGAAGNSQGMGVIGFNNMTRKYERVWFDSHSTAMLKSEGDFFKDRDEINWTDQWCDPASGKITTTQSTLRRMSDKEFVFTQIETLANKEQFLTLRVEYKKAE